MPMNRIEINSTLRHPSDQNGGDKTFHLWGWKFPVQPKACLQRWTGRSLKLQPVSSFAGEREVRWGWGCATSVWCIIHNTYGRISKWSFPSGISYCYYYLGHQCSSVCVCVLGGNCVASDFSRCRNSRNIQMSYGCLMNTLTRPSRPFHHIFRYEHIYIPTCARLLKRFLVQLLLFFLLFTFRQKKNNTKTELTKHKAEN